MHLILSASWVTKKPSEIAPGLYTLYINKAITFHNGGVTYLDEFKSPRRVTYFLNYMTKYVTSGFMSDEEGEQIEVGLAAVYITISVTTCTFNSQHIVLLYFRTFNIVIYLGIESILITCFLKFVICLC